MIFAKDDAMIQEQDALSREAIKEHLGEMPVYLYREIDSTSNEAKRRIAAGESGTFLTVAEGQTAGRGRQGKSFYSPEGTGIYMTLSVPVDLAPGDAFWVTGAVAVALFCAIRDTCGVEAEIKWVNDLYLRGKKIAGILTEAISDPETGRIRYLLIGVGINWQTTDFPEELCGVADSLFAVGVSRNRMIGEAALSISKTLAKQDTSYLDLYRRHSMVLGKEVYYFQNGERFAARALDIDDNGGLVVEHEDGSRTTLQSGEITLRLQ